MLFFLFVKLLNLKKIALLKSLNRALLLGNEFLHILPVELNHPCDLFDVCHFELELFHWVIGDWEQVSQYLSAD